MRIAVCGHSLVHVRQRRFFRHLARLGHDVMVVCPDRWASLTCSASGEDGSHDTLPWSYQVVPLPALGAPNMYQFQLPDLIRTMSGFRPDVVYCQEEVASLFTLSALDAAKALGAARALFVWENEQAPTPQQEEVLRHLDLLVCGNDAAARLHSAAPQWCCLPQVGVDCDHFQARPNVPRQYDVAYIGRPVPEKGVEYLRSVWPTAVMAPWTDWLLLPWVLSQVKVVVAYSQDTPHWREQAMPYVAVEAMAAGCAVVTSQAGAIPWWLGGGYTLECPGATLVPQASPDALRGAIGDALSNWEERGRAGREWVVRHLSSPVVARQLEEQLKLAWEGSRVQPQ